MSFFYYKYKKLKIIKINLYIICISYTNYMSWIADVIDTKAIRAIRKIEKCLNMEASNKTYMDVNVSEIPNYICTLRITFFNDYYGLSILLGKDKDELVYPINDYDEPLKINNLDEVVAFIKKIPDNVIIYIKENL